MAVLDFPDAPVLDQVWDAPSGAAYRWDGTVWVSLSGGGGGGGGTTPPPSGGVVIHDATLVGEGLSTYPLGINTVFLDTEIAEAVIDAQPF